MRACVRKPRGDVVSSDNEPVIDLSEPVGGGQGQDSHAGTHATFRSIHRPRPLPLMRGGRAVLSRRDGYGYLLHCSLHCSRVANGTLPSNREIPTVAGRIGRECVSVVDQWPDQSKSMDYCYCIDGSGPIDPSNNSSQSGMSQADRT